MKLWKTTTPHDGEACAAMERALKLLMESYACLMQACMEIGELLEVDPTDGDALAAAIKNGRTARSLLTELDEP